MEWASNSRSAGSNDEWFYTTQYKVLGTHYVGRGGETTTTPQLSKEGCTRIHEMKNILT